MSEIQKIDNKKKFNEMLKKVSFRFPVAEISSSTGYSKGSVSEILKGNRSPTDEFLEKFIKVYNLQSDDYENLYMVQEQIEPYGLKAENIDLKKIIVQKDKQLYIYEKHIENLEEKVHDLEEMLGQKKQNGTS